MTKKRSPESSSNLSRKFQNLWSMTKGKVYWKFQKPSPPLPTSNLNNAAAANKLKLDSIIQI